MMHRNFYYVNKMCHKCTGIMPSTFNRDMHGGKINWNFVREFLQNFIRMPKLFAFAERTCYHSHYFLLNIYELLRKMVIFIL